MFLQTIAGAGDLIPATWTLDSVFGGVTGLLGNTTVLGALGIVVAVAFAPKLYRTFKRMVSRA